MLALLVGLLQLPLDRLALRLTLLDLLLLELCFGHSGAHGLDATPRQHQRRKQGEDNRLHYEYAIGVLWLGRQ